MLSYLNASWGVLAASFITGLLLKRVPGITNWRTKWYAVLTMNVIEIATFMIDGAGALLSSSFLFWKKDWWLLIVIAGVSMAIVAVQFMIYATNLDRWWNIRLYYFPNSTLLTGLKPEDRREAEGKYALGASHNDDEACPLEINPTASEMRNSVKMSMFAWF